MRMDRQKGSKVFTRNKKKDGRTLLRGSGVSATLRIIQRKKKFFGAIKKERFDKIFSKWFPDDQLACKFQC